MNIQRLLESYELCSLGNGDFLLLGLLSKISFIRTSLCSKGFLLFAEFYFDLLQFSYILPNFACIYWINICRVSPFILNKLQ